MDKTREIIIPGLEPPPETPIPKNLQPPEPDLTPDLTEVLKKLEAAGQKPETTKSGLSVISQKNELITPGTSIEDPQLKALVDKVAEEIPPIKRPTPVTLPQEVSAAYLTNDLKEAIYRLLQHQEFKRNARVLRNTNALHHFCPAIFA